MMPFPRLHERRHFQRFEMATRDCRLTLIRGRGLENQCQNCILVDLSYGGMRFHSPFPIRNGEVLEFVVSIASPVKRSGFCRGRACWGCPIDSQKFDCGAELFEESKGLFGPDEEWQCLAGQAL